MHEKKSSDVTTNVIVDDIENYVKCPRCKYIIEQTKKILQKKTTIDINDLLQICIYCRKSAQKAKECKACQRVVSKVFTSIGEIKKENEISNIESCAPQLFKESVVKNEEVKSITRTHSDSYLSKLCLSQYPTARPSHNLLIGQMFGSDRKITESIQKEALATSIRFSKTVQKTPESQRHYPSEVDIYLSDSVQTLDTDGMTRNLNIPVEIPTADYLSKKLEEVPEKEKDQNYLSKYITSILKDGNREKSLNKIQHLKLHQRAKSYDSQFPDTHRSIKASNISGQSTNNLTAGTDFPFEKDREADIDTIIKKKSKYKDNSDLVSLYTETDAQKNLKSKHLKKYSSVESILTLRSTTSQEPSEDFSYKFLKEAVTKKTPLKSRKSSSELIKETQELLSIRAEMERKKKEEERKKKLEEQERKRIAHEEKKRIAAEKQKLLEEEKMKEYLKTKKESVLEEEILQEDLIADIKSEQDDSKKKSVSERVSARTRSISIKSKKSETTKSEKSSSKIPKDTEKKDKLSMDKEEKLRLKEEKERKKKEMEEQKRREKEEKQREKEEKQREKLDKMKQKEIEAKLKPSKVKEEKGEKPVKTEETLKKKTEDIDHTDNLKKILAEQERKKAEELKLKKQQEDELQKLKDAAEKKVKEEAEIALKNAREAKSELKSQDKSVKPKIDKKIEEPKTKELNINQIKMRKPSPDDLILQLVKLKQSEERNRLRPRRLSELNVPPLVVKAHKGHKNLRSSNCVLCVDSDLELDVENMDSKKEKGEEFADMIMGQKILKYKPPLPDKPEEKKKVPLLFHTTAGEELPQPLPNKVNIDVQEEPPQKTPFLAHSKFTAEQEVPKGIIRYALSDRTFIDKGWTMLPTEKVVRKMNVYRMRPAHPEFDWFEHNKNKKLMHYDTGEKLAEFDDNGRGRWYYRNGRLALDYYDAEEINTQQRIVIYSSGEPDERGRYRPLGILATFDYLGNGIVFDHSGKIRLKYNQTEGVVLDRALGPVSHWKWHTLNDPPVLQQVMIDTQMAHKDPYILKLGGHGENKPRADNEEMLAIEFDNFIKEKSKKLSQKFKPFQIKMKALKINEQFSLKVLDQATIYLIYRDGLTNLKLNIGMILDHQEIVDTDTAEVGEVSNNLERFPARTDSLAGLQKSVAFAQRVERARVERERRLRPAGLCASADRLTAGASKPLRPPLRTLPSDTTVCTAEMRCKCRKPPCNSLYYDTRLI